MSEGENKIISENLKLKRDFNLVYFLTYNLIK